MHYIYSFSHNTCFTTDVLAYQTTDVLAYHWCSSLPDHWCSSLPDHWCSSLPDRNFRWSLNLWRMELTRISFCGILSHSAINAWSSLTLVVDPD